MAGRHAFLRAIVLPFLLIAATRVASIPATPWEFDEPLFMGALRDYQPLQHYPPPPGYPLFILTGRLVRLLLGSEFTTLIAISLIASLGGYVLLARAFAEITRSTIAGIAGATLFYMSPAMLMHSTMPISEPGALALLAAAIGASARAIGQRAGAGSKTTEQAPDDRRPEGQSDGSRMSPPVVFAVLASATVGWRPQYSIFVLPLLFMTVLLIRSWRARLVTLFTFGLVCVLWLIPLVMAVGGVDELITFETKQAEYLSAHDAAQSRSGWTLPQIAIRFVAHPWGTKLLALPILLLALFGAWRAIALRRPNGQDGTRRLIVPLTAAASLYFAFAMRAMDPADGVRYAMPITLAVSCFAGIGAARLGSQENARRAAVAVLIYSTAAVAWVAVPIVERRSPSPPMRAIELARRSVPGTVVLHDQALWPHARLFLPQFNPKRLDAGLREYAERPDVPLLILADGQTSLPGTVAFSWRPSDAYSKLTRNHYRVISVSPLPPKRRFVPVRGVFAAEREIEGEEWRWLAKSAEIRLPPIDGRRVRLRIGLPVLYPREENAVSIRVNGGQPIAVSLRRGAFEDVRVPLTGPGARIEVEAREAFVPADVPGSLSRDPRSLAVKLYEVEIE